MGELPWQPPCPFLKYILNKENLFKPFLGWKESSSAACEMQAALRRGVLCSLPSFPLHTFLLLHGHLNRVAKAAVFHLLFIIPEWTWVQDSLITTVL